MSDATPMPAHLAERLASEHERFGSKIQTKEDVQTDVKQHTQRRDHHVAYVADAAGTEVDRAREVAAEAALRRIEEDAARGTGGP